MRSNVDVFLARYVEKETLQKFSLVTFSEIHDANHVNELARKYLPDVIIVEIDDVEVSKSQEWSISVIIGIVLAAAGVVVAVLQLLLSP